MCTIKGDFEDERLFHFLNRTEPRDLMIADPSVELFQFFVRKAEIGFADGDKLLNAYEYTLGSDLRDGTSLSGLTIRVNGTNHLELSHPLRDGVTEFAALIEQSGDLQTWSSTSGTLDQLGTTSNGDGTSTVSYRSSNPIDPAVDLYFRIRVVSLP